jgi:hypothetical protein
MGSSIMGGGKFGSGFDQGGSICGGGWLGSSMPGTFGVAGSGSLTGGSGIIGPGVDGVVRTSFGGAESRFVSVVLAAK